MKTRKNKGGAFFSDNKHKSCDTNKKDWRKNWEKFRDRENNRPYALYDSSYLYPGSMNLRGAVPTQGNLLDEQGQPRKCPEPPIKSCEDNKYDWQNYWSSNPEYSGFIPTHLYPSDTNLKPVPNGLKTPDGKPCIKAEFTQYVNSRAYDQMNKEQRNQPEQLKQQFEEQWQKVDLTRNTTPKVMPPLQHKQSRISISKDDALDKYQEKIYEREEKQEKLERKEKKMDLYKIQIIKHQLTNPTNEKTFIKLILAFLRKQSKYRWKGHFLLDTIIIELNEDMAYTQQGILEEKEAEEKKREEQEELQRRQEGKLSIPKPPKIYPANAFFEKLANRLTLKSLEQILKSDYRPVIDYMMKSDIPSIGSLNLHEIEYTLGTQEFKRLLIPLQTALYEPAIKQYGQQVQQYKKQQTRKREKFLPGIIDEQPDETQYLEFVSIIVSHNTRIQCLLDGIQQNQSEDKIRFMNCAILKLELTPEKVKLSMVYQGELSDKEAGKINVDKPYYVQDVSTRPGHIQYPTFVNEYATLKNSMKLPDIIYKYTFYIIRHGQAEHNVKSMGVSSTLGLKLDTSITELGRQQAENAGKYLKDYLIDLKMPTRFFVSDLIRTYQTLDSILNMLGIIESIPDNVKGNFKLRPTPIVLPCANELPIKGILGQCDKATADAPGRQKMARENDTKCVLRSDGTFSADCNRKVDWHTLYFPFYQYVSQRIQEDTASETLNTNTCQDSNMIAMALLYLMTDKMETMQQNDKIRLINDYVVDNQNRPTKLVRESPEESVTSNYVGGRRTRKLKLNRNKRNRTRQ
jgi:broad specificity phosphatase PhoE